jgi:hypothetical protein
MLPKSMILMSESADLTDNLFKTRAVEDIITLISSADIEPFLRYLIVRDASQSKLNLLNIWLDKRPARDSADKALRR